MRTLRLIEGGQEFATPREEKGSSVVHAVHKEDRRDHQTAKDHHQHSKSLIHFLKQKL
jgi:hypothetical protein